MTRKSCAFNTEGSMVYKAGIRLQDFFDEKWRDLPFRGKKEKPDAVPESDVAPFTPDQLQGQHDPEPSALDDLATQLEQLNLSKVDVSPSPQVFPIPLILFSYR
ncbi:hypothetical protein MSAN_01598700 [Mycena sanguinolenta]|uniref:Uncharacterized protein n=1 Tax=Mycena sanguinolenta TaxID=230812 RepID=A0A8H6Y0A9_9AGAR|nr:hypothetical protein MSAN_01598700 [Mycena sanguinolenta]